jgi:membrane protease YdiL (CAAX protease family)
MTDLSSTTGRAEVVSHPKAPTWVGLFIALFGMLIVRQAVTYFYPTLTLVAALWKESLIWLCVIALLFVIRRGERLSLRSVGIGTASWIKSLLWGVILAIACAAVGGIIATLTHYGHNESAEAFSRLPVWLMSAICVRAGVAEELFFRGYAIERLEALGLNRFMSAAIPLAIFAVGHWTGGWANIVIALALGAILSAFYLWRRDLVANIIGHFLVDFVFNVLPKLFS